MFQRPQSQNGHIDAGKDQRDDQHLQKCDKGGTDDLLLQGEFWKIDPEDDPQPYPDKDERVGRSIFFDFVYQNSSSVKIDCIVTSEAETVSLCKNAITF